MIVEEPQDVYGSAGGTVLFRAAAVGAAPLAFSWQRDRSPIEASEFFEIESGDSCSTLTISNLSFGHPGLYRCLVSNGQGAARTREALLSMSGPLMIVAQPRDASVPMWGRAEFRVGVSGTRPISYTWYHGSETISANPSNTADTDTLLLGPVTMADLGLYWCEVTGGAPSATRSSGSARLRILPAGVEPWWELMR